MRQINSLLFGTAGIPIRVEGNTIDGIKGVKKLGLSAMELEFVHSVNISEEATKNVRKVAEGEGIILTSHAPYYINLNALEEKKAEASMHRIILSARRTFQCGGWSATFHPGFYFKQDPEKVYDSIKKRIKDIVNTLRNDGVEIWVRPETTGKATQFGTLKEICRISQEVENVMPCIDFSHLHARTAGKENTLPEFRSQLEMVEKMLGKEGLKNIHAHVAGINYGEKGEKNHLKLDESDFNYKDLLKALKEFKAQGVVICESPNIEDDALLLQRTYNKIK